jgi:hypothetical protein
LLARFIGEWELIHPQQLLRLKQLSPLSIAQFVN